MRTPAGLSVPCCRPAWIDEYARRAGELMRAYARGGRGKVLWLTLPVPRDPARQPYALAVNIAARRAAAGVPGTTIVPLDNVFTPGGVYRAFMLRGGRSVRVGHSDGIHLSLRGSAIAERIVEPLLELPPR